MDINQPALNEQTSNNFLVNFCKGKDFDAECTLKDMNDFNRVWEKEKGLKGYFQNTIRNQAKIYIASEARKIAYDTFCTSISGTYHGLRAEFRKRLEEEAKIIYDEVDGQRESTNEEQNSEASNQQETSDEKQNPTIIKQPKKNNALNREYEIPKLVNELDNSPNVKPYDIFEHLTLCINTACGMGKTINLEEVLKNNPKLRVLILQFRCTLVNASLIKLIEHGFKSYKDFRGEVKADKLICQIDSLWKVRGEYDLIILDEFKYTGMHIAEFVKNKVMVFDALMERVSEAKYVIAMDAYLDDYDIEFFKDCGRDPHFYYNTFAKHHDVELHLKENRVVLNRFIFNCIAKAVRMAIATNSNTYAKQLYEIIKRTYPNVKVGLFNKDTPGIHDNDPIATWPEYDIVIYTPVVAAGSSFTLEHFDIVCGYFTSLSCCAELACQQLFRVRNIKTNTIVLCINQGHQYSVDVDSYEGMEQHLVAHTKTLYQDLEKPYLNQDLSLIPRVNYKAGEINTKDPLFKLICRSAFITNESKRDYLARILYLLKRQGISPTCCELYRETPQLLNDAQQWKDSAHTAKEEEIDDIVNAKDITFKQLRRLLNIGNLTPKQKCQIVKAQLREHFNLKSHTPIDSKYVKDYRPMKLQYTQLVKLLPLIGVKLSDVQLKFQELFHHEITKIIHVFNNNGGTIDISNTCMSEARTDILKLKILITILNLLGFASPFDNAELIYITKKSPNSTSTIEEFAPKLKAVYDFLFDFKVWQIFRKNKPNRYVDDKNKLETINTLLQTLCGIKISSYSVKLPKTDDIRRQYFIIGLHRWKLVTTPQGKYLYPNGYESYGFIPTLSETIVDNELESLFNIKLQQPPDSNSPQPSDGNELQPSDNNSPQPSDGNSSQPTDNNSPQPSNDDLSEDDKEILSIMSQKIIEHTIIPHNTLRAMVPNIFLDPIHGEVMNL